MMKDRWVQMKETEKEDYEELGMAIFLSPAIMLSGLFLAMLVINIVEALSG